MKINSVTDINGTVIPFAENVKTEQSDFSDYLSQAQEQTKTVSLDDIFEKASKTYGVDEKLLKAMAKTESNFDPNATSYSGAMGIMQLMPETAKELGVMDAYDPEQNIMGGAKYIASLIERYDGNVTYAVAAYNAGSGNVDKYGGIPPFEQVQNYVKKIAGYLKNNDYEIPQQADLVSYTTTQSVPDEVGEPQTLGEQITDKIRELFTYDEYLEFLELFLQQLTERLQQKLNEKKQNVTELGEAQQNADQDELQNTDSDAYNAYQNFPSNNRIAVLLRPNNGN